MRSRRAVIVLCCLAASAAGCSLLYPFDLPDATDADASEADDGVAADADGDDGGETPTTCGNGVVDPGEECDTALARSCTTSCGSTGTEECAPGCASFDCIAPTSESCNGVDDDCNGATDEGYACAAGLDVPCTTPCGVSGTATCTTTCEVPPPWECRAADEPCNGCDDDRDRTTDEDCPCATDWVVEHPLAPGPESLADVSIAPDGLGFIVATSGRILRWDGSRWSPETSPTTANLRHVDALSGSFAVAVGIGGMVLWWDGVRWRYDTEPSGLTTLQLYSVHAVAEDDVWVSGASGTLLHWSGGAWSLVPSGVARHLYEIWGFAADDLYAGGRAGTVLHYDGGGWTSIAPPGLTADVDAIWGPDPSTVYFAGSDGMLLRYEPASGAWTSIPTGVIESFSAMWGSGPDDIWIIGGFAGGAVVHYDGAAWTQDTSVPAIDRRGPVGVSGSGPDDVFLVMHDGGIVHGDGTEWRPMDGGVTVSLRGVWGTSPQDVFAIGTAGEIGGTWTSTAVLRYDGTAWTLPHWLSRTDGRDVWASSPSDLYLVAANGNIPHFDGTAWATLTAFAGIDLLGVSGLDAAHVHLVGGQLSEPWNPVVFERVGTGWSPMPFRPGLPNEQFLGVHGTSVDTLIAVGSAGVIGHRAVGEAAFDQVASGTTETLRGVWVFSDTDAFAVGDGGTILRWDGAAWTSMTSPGDPWEGFRLSGVWGSAPGNVFAVGEMSTLLRYDGTTWTRLGVEVLSDLTGVWGSSANNVFVVADDRGGKILHRCGPAW